MSPETLEKGVTVKNTPSLGVFHFRLLVADAAKLQSGAFYLDREPQVKHMGGQVRSRVHASANSVE